MQAKYTLKASPTTDSASNLHNSKTGGILVKENQRQLFLFLKQVPTLHPLLYLQKRE